MLIIASTQLHFVGCVMKLFKKLVKVKKIIYKQSINIFFPTDWRAYQQPPTAAVVV